MTKNKQCFYILLTTLFFLSGCIHSSSLPPLAVKTSPEKSIVIHDVSLFTGNPDQGIMDHVNILIQGNKVTRIGKFPISDIDGMIIEGKGKTVIPGLIDHHIHISSPGSPSWFPVMPNDTLVERNLSSFLYAGVTTVFDMGGPLYDLEALSQRIAMEEKVNPRFFYAGKMLTKKGGHPDPMFREIIFWPVDIMLIKKLTFSLEDQSEIANAIAENKAHGSSLTKIMVDQIPLGIPSLYENLIKDIVIESDKAGMVVGSHIGSESDLLTGLNSGVRFFCHAPYRSAVSDSTIAAMKKNQVVIIPTLVVFEYLANFFNNKLQFNALDRKILDPAILDAYMNVPSGGLEPSSPQFESWIHDLSTYQDIKYENVRKMKEAGITIIAGSDSPNVANVGGSSLHTELRFFVERCGFTPMEAVSAATSISGEMLAKTTGVEGLGRIKEDGMADLVILNADFREDIRNTENIYMVISNGRIVDRKTD
jgi:imidazolonepropionase-like amidohydrolase